MSKLVDGESSKADAPKWGSLDVPVELWAIPGFPEAPVRNDKKGKAKSKAKVDQAAVGSTIVAHAKDNANLHPEIAELLASLIVETAPEGLSEAPLAALENEGLDQVYPAIKEALAELKEQLVVHVGSQPKAA